MEREMKNGRQHETEQSIVDEFVLIDMDRSLLDSDAKIRIQCSLLVEHGVNQADADETCAMILGSKGKNLAEEDFLRGIYGDEIIDAVNQDMLELARTDENFRKTLMYGTASARLLAVLKQQGYSYGIFTHGVHDNQMKKITLVRACLDETEESLPAMVTDEHEKALHAAGWVDESGLIDIPVELTGGRPYKARSLAIIDDKRKNLVSGSASNIVGLHIDNHGDTSEGQRSLEHIATMLEQGVSIVDMAEHIAA